MPSRWRSRKIALPPRRGSLVETGVAARRAAWVGAAEGAVLADMLGRAAGRTLRARALPTRTPTGAWQAMVVTGETVVAAIREATAAMVGQAVVAVALRRMRASGPLRPHMAQMAATVAARAWAARLVGLMELVALGARGAAQRPLWLEVAETLSRATRGSGAPESRPRAPQD